MSDASDQGWLTHLSGADQQLFQDGTALIAVLTDRVRGEGEIGLLELSVTDPLDSASLAAMFTAHADKAAEQADVLRQVSEQFALLAEIAARATTPT